MPRRRTVALASTIALLATGALVVGGIVAVTQTGTGQGWVRDRLLATLAPRVKGRLVVGRISGNFITGVTVDSIEVRGPDDSLFVFVRRARVAFDPRDLLDKRVLLRRVEIERPIVRLSQAEDGTWNYRAILGKGGPKRPRTQPGFGDYIVADSVVVRDGRFVLTLPWHPADSLQGARRDSAIAYNLARRDATIRRRTPGLFQRTYTWDLGYAASPYVRIADPDSVGKFFALGRVDVDESDPPFRFRNVTGGVRVQGESVWVNVRHFDLPGSTGRGVGKVVWGSGLPNRYDFDVVGDSVSMRDLAWIYPTLPRTGGGRMRLGIRNNAQNLRVLEYAIRDMDVRSTKSRLRGNMTYGVGGPVLVVKDVALRAEPVDFDLLRTLAGGPFPYDWQGTLTGTIRARGGPVNRWQVDEARLTYADKHVRGAVSRFTGRGGLDILSPAFTRFLGLAVDVDVLDLRTIEYLNPNFPRLGGTISGRAVLDSSWLDVRFRDARVAHRDGPGAPSELTGSGRVTYGETMRYDLALDARPLSLTTLARSYPGLPLRGLVSGPIRAVGTVEDLRLETTLAGAAGTLAFDGTIDAFEPSYAARGTFRADRLDLRALLERPSLPAAQLALAGTIDLRGATPADAVGTLAVDVGRSPFEGGRVYAGVARLRVGEGRLRVDTLDVETTAGRVLAAGGIGLAATTSDSLAFRVSVDSLGGLRPWLAPRLAAARVARAEAAASAAAETAAAAATPDAPGRIAPDAVNAAVAADAGAAARAAAELAVEAAEADTLAGSFRLVGLLAGSIAPDGPGLRLVGSLRGREVAYGATRAARLDATLSLGDALRGTGILAQLSADSLRVGRLALSRATGRFVADAVDAPAAPTDATRVAAGVARGLARGAAGERAATVAATVASGVRVRAGRFDLRAGTDSGASLALHGRTTIGADSTVVVLDSTSLAPTPGREYALATPATIVARTAGNAVSLDSLVLRGPGGARLAVSAALADSGPVRGSAAAERVSVADVAAVLGLASRVGSAAESDRPASTRAVVPPARFDGLLSAGLSLAGTRGAPAMTLRATGDSLVLAGAPVERLVADARYAGRRLDGTLDLLRDGRSLLTARAALPLDLALFPGVERRLDAPLTASVRADSMDLALLAAVAPGTVRDVRGRVRTAFDVSGTWERPQLFGTLQVVDGAAAIPAAGTRLDAIAADLQLRGDSLAINRVWARSGAAGDTVSLSGAVVLAPLRDPRLDLRLAARNFLAVDRPRLATLWVSTPTPLTVQGTLSGATVRGAARLERGRIYIPELIDKRIVDLNEYRDVVDTTVFRDRSLLPGAPSALVENLTLDAVTLSVGNDVWLRSPETNIKLGGTLAVTRAVSRDAGRDGGRPRSELALLGALGVERGTYRLDLLPLAQPVFDVLPGQLRFFGTPDLNPTLEIQAVHTVRQLRQTSNRPDVRVQVNLGGTLNQPTLRLASADDPPIPDTDLISYLVTGEPAAAFFGSAQGAGQGGAAVTSIVSRLAGSLVSGALSRGGPFDIVQVQTGAVASNPAQAGQTSDNIANILASTRLGVGGQLGNRTFYSFSAGFCGFRQQDQASQANFLTQFTRGLGFRVERRLTPSVSLAGSIEPGSQQAQCLNDNSRFFFQQTPPQVGLDVSKTWTF